MGTFELLAARLARALRPLAFATQSEDGIRNLVAYLGWTLPTVPPSLSAVGEDLVQLNTSLAEMTVALRRAESGDGDSSEVDSTLRSLALDLALVVERFHGLPGRLRAELPADYIAATHIDTEIEGRIFDLLLSMELANNSPVLYRLLRAAGVIEVSNELIVLDRFQPVFEQHHIRWDRLFQFLDPKSLARDVYGWGTPLIDATHLFEELLPLSFALGMPAEFRYATAAFTQKTAPGANSESEPVPQLWIPIFRSDALTFFIVATVLAKAGPNEPQGLALALVPSAGGDLSIPLGEELELKLKAAAQVGTGAALILRPDRPPDVALDIEGATGSALTSGRIAAAITWRAPEWKTPQGMSTADGTYVTAHSISIGLGAEAGSGNVDIFADLIFDQGKLIVARPKEDGLLSSVLPPEGLSASFSLSARWSRDGVRFQGSAGLDATIPLNISVGPLELQSLHFAISGDEGRVAAQAALTAAVKLGPVMLTIEHVGLSAAARAVPGNLGPVDVDISFKPPSGAGLSIDAAGVTGGGFLYFDPEKGQYTGVVQLSLEGRITVKGIGLIATRLPDNVKGYSLLVIITAEGFKPIPLPLGFRLIGIGGLLAVNRTFDEEVLRAGLKNHTLDSVMFPRDPVRNAPQILSNLNKVFPPANGHHLFGPMAQIAWGTPVLITADLAVVLELGARLRLLILAQVVAILPRRENDLIRLQMDAVGVIDFDQGTAALDATLYDSRLLKKFVLTGDMAMRLKWEASPNFALAVGGLHPAFNPPPNFPKLERIAINLCAGDNPRFRCEAYYALTSNTVQFGARAELYAAAAGFSIQGEVGYDVLLQLDPFQFLADFCAQVQLKRGSTNLFKVRVEGALAGPRPLHIKGKATFEVLWWDVSIRFDKTLVEGEPPPRPEPVDVLPRLKEALGNPGNWTAQLPAGQRPMVTLRAGPAAAADVRLHPLGTLMIKQGVVPLNLEISRFGPAAPAGARRFTISRVSLGGQNQTTQPVKDFFAPAQFFELSDAEKLSRPSFEPMAAGVSIGSQEFVFSADAGDWLEVEAIEFETWIVDTERNAARRSASENPKHRYQLSPELLGRQARYGAAGNSDLRRSGKAKYRAATGKYRVAKEGWSIVATGDLTVKPVPGIEDGKPRIYSDAAQALGKLKQANPTKAAGLKILRLSELL